MVTGIIGRKVGMTQVFDADGTVHPGHRHQGRPVRRRAGEDRADRRLRGRAARPRRGDAGEGEQADRGPLQEGQRAADARAPRSASSRRAATRVKAGDQVLVVDLRRRRARRRHRHRPRQGLPGRRQAPPFRGRRGDARLDVPPRARIDRRLVVPVARRQGHARGGPHGRRAASRCTT